MDIVARLRSNEAVFMDVEKGTLFLNEAAAEIEQLRAALKPFVDAKWDLLPDEHDNVPTHIVRGTYGITAGHVRRAREAFHNEQSGDGK